MLVGAKDKIDDVLKFKSNMDSGMFLPAQLAAAKALYYNTDLSAEEIAQKSLEIAASICVYTNNNIIVEVI